MRKESHFFINPNLNPNENNNDNENINETLRYENENENKKPPPKLVGWRGKLKLDVLLLLN